MSDKVAGTLRANFLNAFRQQQIKKKTMLEEIVKEGVEHESALSDEDISKSEFFSSQNVTDDTNNVELSPNYTFEETNFSEEVANDINPNVISNLLADYMSALEVDVLFSYVEDSGVSRDEVDELLDEVGDAEDGEVSELINGFFNSNELEPSAIFAILSYLYEETKKKQNHKERTLSLLKKLLEKYSRQNSAYLSEFFEMSKSPQAQKSLKMATGLAKLSSGELSIDSLKSAIDFIDNYLDSDYENIVSKCIKLRLKILARITQSKLNFEGKAELSGYVQYEKSLISVNSINCDYKDFKHIAESEVLKDGAVMDAKTSQVLNAIIDFCNNPAISSFAFKMLLNNLGIDKKYYANLHLKTKLVDMFLHMPMTVFDNDNTKRLKFIDGIRTFKISADGNAINNDDTYSSIIKPRKVPIKLV